MTFSFARLFYLILLIGMCMLSSCSNTQNICFANYEWKINDGTKYIHDKDISWVFSTEDQLLSPQTTLIGSEIAINRYDGLKQYFNGVLGDISLKLDSVLLYIPTKQMIFATYSGNEKDLSPSSYTPLDTEKRNSFFNVFGVAELDTQGEQLLTNLFFNKKQKRFVVLHRFNYGNRPVAMLTVLQTPSAKTSKLAELLGSEYALSRRVMDYSNPLFTEMIGWDITKAKNIALANYDLGQKLLKIKDKKSKALSEKEKNIEPVQPD